MVRACKAALVAGGLVSRMAVGFVGFTVVAVSVLPPPEPDAGGRSGPGEPARPGSRVVLTVPQGSLAGSLTVIDASGRELATLIHWYSGSTSIVARRSGGVGVNGYLNRNGSANLLLIGTVKETSIDAKPDGTATTFERDLSRMIGHRTGGDAGDPADSEL